MNSTGKNNKIRQRVAGVGFIKSRRSDSAVMDMAALLIARAEARGVEIIEVIVDRGSSNDLDRRTIDRLHRYMEQPYIKAVVLRSYDDVAEGIDDQLTFISLACNNGAAVLVVPVEHAEYPENFLQEVGGL